MKQARALPLAAVAAVITILVSSPSALARPAGLFGSSCVSCHAGDFLSGRAVPDQLLDVVGDFQAEIPLGQFGDPDRGVGPLESYSTVPGGTFELLLDIKAPDPDVVMPSTWAAGIKRIYATDPDFQNGDSDKLNWRNDQLTLVGAQLPGSGLTDVPLDETEWTLQTDETFFGPFVPGVDAYLDEQYYTSADGSGHIWSGATQMSLTVTVPAGVQPGWYDIEVSVEGLDVNFEGFYDEEHFYLNVKPEPATALLLLAAAPLLRRRR